MRVYVTDQLVTLAVTLLTGICAGILYDMFRVLRRKFRGGRIITAVTDLIFCVSFACALFLLGYIGGGGVYRLYMPFVSLLGCAVYFVLFSKAVLALLLLFADFLEKIIRVLLSPFVFAISFAKKAAIFLKKIFYYKKKWYTIRLGRNLCLSEATKTLAKTEGHTDETEKGKYYY